MRNIIFHASPYEIKAPDAVLILQSCGSTVCFHNLTPKPEKLVLDNGSCTQEGAEWAGLVIMSLVSSNVFQLDSSAKYRPGSPS